MGITAENVAERWHLTHQELDSYAVCSQQKTAAALANGSFKDEIVPVTVKSRKGGTVIDDTDESSRPDVTAAYLARLRPAFKPGGW